MRYRRAKTSEGIDLREPSADLTQVTESQWQAARRRAQLIRELEERPNRTRADVAAAAAQLGISVIRVYALLKLHRAEPTVTSLLDRRPGPGVGDSRLPPEIDALIEEAIQSTYLSKQRVRLVDLIKEICVRCRVRGLSPPSRKAISTRLRRKPRELIVERREGRRAARARFDPIKGRLEPSGPLGLVQIDHTLVDVIVVDSATRSPIQRPWLTVAIDVYTRCVVGFHLSLDAPSATSVALCLAHAVLPKDAWLSARNIAAEWPISGVMKTLHLDNGKEFHSEALQRGCEEYGIALQYRPVRTPHYGGHVERLIGTLMGKVHLLPGTTFSNISQRGLSDPEKTAAMTLTEVECWLGHAIAGLYHQNLHRTLGSTPLAAWHSAAAALGARRQVADPRRFLLDFLPLERRLVRREGIVLHHIAYWSDVLRSAVGDPNPAIVRYDPRDLSRVYWLGPDGIYYDLSYADVRRPSISLWEHRAARKRLQEEGKREVNETAIFNAVEAMREIADGACRESKLQRRQRERRAQHLASAQRDAQADPPEALEEAPSEGSSLLDVEEWA